MLDHLSIQCEDLDAASAFYDTVLATIGGRRVLDFGTVIGYGVDFPDFWIGPVNTGEASREVAHRVHRARPRRGRRVP